MLTYSDHELLKTLKEHSAKLTADTGQEPRTLVLICAVQGSVSVGIWRLLEGASAAYRDKPAQTFIDRLEMVLIKYRERKSRTHTCERQGPDTEGAW